MTPDPPDSPPERARRRLTRADRDTLDRVSSIAFRAGRCIDESARSGEQDAAWSAIAELHAEMVRLPR